jgi:hypothetical protein
VNTPPAPALAAEAAARYGLDLSRLPEHASGQTTLTCEWCRVLYQRDTKAPRQQIQLCQAHQAVYDRTHPSQPAPATLRLVVDEGGVVVRQNDPESKP